MNNKFKKIIFILLYVIYLLLPLVGFNQVIVNHNGYTSIFDTTLKYPIMVTWINTKDRLLCDDDISRKDRFSPDPILYNSTNIQISYSHLNKYQRKNNLKSFDRGHMCPSADNKCSIIINEKKIESKQLQKECFYFTNISPQYHNLNAGLWKSLEEHTRDLSLDYDSVIIWCGAIGSLFTYEDITIPEKFWKVIYIKKINKWECYIFENKSNNKKNLNDCLISKDYIEKIVDLKFK